MNNKYIDGVLLKKMIIQAANSLEANKGLVDGLNVFPVPDGDTGTNMSLTINSASKEVCAVKGDDIEFVADAMANGSLMGARGNSGVILSQLFRGFAKACKGKDKLTSLDFAKALKSASDTAYKAVMKPIEGTILTVAREMGEKAIELSKKELFLEGLLKQTISHGEKVLDKTPEMLKVLKEAGVVDAGGKGLIVIFYGFYEALMGKEIVIEPSTAVEPVNIHREDISKNIEFGYCTEFIVNGKKIDIEKFKKEILDLGDSMLVVGDDRLVKVHIHTNNPGIVLEHGLKLGELTNLKIDNMRQQHKNKVFVEKDPEKKIPMKEFGMIAVTMGEGLGNIFKDLNVDEIISGGQTMNPSTEDIKKAIDRVGAKQIFIFPNNSNIILAANQAKELSNKNVVVIPSKTVPQGIAAILGFNGDLTLEQNAALMIQALDQVKTGQVTYSVRDTQLNDIPIKKDDILGIKDGKIGLVGSDVDEVAFNLLKDMISEDDEVVTIFYGEDRDQAQAQGLADRMGEIYEDIDIEIYYGGQPLYYYIFSVE